MLARLMAGKPDRRYASVLGQQGGGQSVPQDPVSRAITLLLHSLAIREGGNLADQGDRGMGRRVAAGDVSQAIPWLQHRMQHRNHPELGTQGDVIPVEQMAGNLSKDQHETRYLRSAQNHFGRLSDVIQAIQQMQQLGGKDLGVRSFVPGTDEYQEANNHTAMHPEYPMFRRNLNNDMPRLMQTLGRMPIAQGTTRRISHGLETNDLQSLVELHNLLSGGGARSEGNRLHDNLAESVGGLVDAGLTHPRRQAFAPRGLYL